MKSLTVVVNLRTGLVDPFYKARAVETFRVLRKAGYSWSPAEIKTWALANGWNVRGAEQLEEVAAGVLAGKAYRLRGSGGLRSDSVNYWREKAKQAG